VVVAGLVTVTCTIPGVATIEVGTLIVNWLPVTNEVVWAVPFHFTCALLLKLVPLTVSTKAALFAVTLLGTRAEMLGMVPAEGVFGCDDDP